MMEMIGSKRFGPSLHVQATCSSQEWFTSLDPSWPGPVGASHIFKNSLLYQTLQSFDGSTRNVLIADSRYGDDSELCPYLLTPYSNPTTPIEIYFNEIHTKEYKIIGKCLAQLKSRFPALNSKLRVRIDRAPGMVLACAVLHNIAKHLGDEGDCFEQLEQESAEDAEEEDESDGILSADQVQERNIIRDEIATLLYNSRSSRTIVS
jgi:hypothetical protein